MQIQEGEEGEADEEAAEGTTTAAAGGAAASGSSPARRRPRARASLLRAVAAAGRPLSLLNLRLSLVRVAAERGCRASMLHHPACLAMFSLAACHPPLPLQPRHHQHTHTHSQVDRDFTEADYQLLLRLDELEAGGPPQEPPPPLPEDQLALLPVHTHRTPTKKGRAGKASAAFGAAAAAGASPAGTPGKAAVLSGGAAAPRTPAPAVPVLVETAHSFSPLPAPPTPHPLPAAWAGSPKVLAAAACSSADGIKAARPAAPCAPCAPGLEISAAPPGESEGSDCEDDEPVCSVCLEHFADGAKVRAGVQAGAQDSPATRCPGEHAVLPAH